MKRLGTQSLILFASLILSGCFAQDTGPDDVGGMASEPGHAALNGVEGGSGRWRVSAGAT
jgi:hypothetical protein